MSAFGSGGYAYGTATTTSYVPQSYNYVCTIKLIANKKNIVENGEFSGNLGGCNAYQSAMNKIIEDSSK